MKKVLVVAVVLAMALIGSMAFAADVTVGGSVQIRSRNFDFGEKNQGADQVDTQQRIMMDINAKAGDVKGKISLWNDFETWGRFESAQGSTSANTGASSAATGTFSDYASHSHSYNNNTITFREAWLLFPLADTGFWVKGGHQLLQLGMGGFFRSQHFGSDAWVAFRDDGPNHFGLVNVKIAEGNTARSDDTDAYVIVDTYKIDDNNKVGIDITSAQDRGGAVGFGVVDAMNIGLNYTGKVGPVNLKAEADLQSGKINKNTASEQKLKGNEIIVVGDMAAGDAAKVNFTVARGSGAKQGMTDNNDAFVTFLDIDPHYTFMYEYKRNTACNKTGSANVSKNTGFCNTTALNIGGTYNASKNLSISLNGWYLTATEKIADLKSGSGTTNDVGTEIDAKIAWKLADGLTWTWDIGMLNPGKGIDADGNTETGIQGILAFTF